MYDSVLKIYDLCGEYLDYVDDIGNECAYTDRIIEGIYEEAEVLRKKHDDYFDNLDTSALEEELIKQTKPLVY